MDGCERPSNSLRFTAKKNDSGTQVDVSGGRECFSVSLEMKGDL